MTDDLLVLGAGGMLGHKVFQQLQSRHWRPWATIRASLTDQPYARIGLFQQGNVLDRIDVTDWQACSGMLQRLRPRAVVNCVGIIKQRAESKMAIQAITVNALLPHRLASILAEWGGRLIQISTDCVYSGRRGAYTEDDPSDAEDLYGRTKALGEVVAPNTITLRTSMVGRELAGHRSLLDWFLQQNHGTVRGFTRALYSGITTNQLAEIVADILEQHRSLSGLFQVASDTISKYRLLCLLRDAYQLDIEIVKDETVVSDRSMVGRRFRDATGWRCPSWPELVNQLASDPTPYREWIAVPWEPATERNG